MKRPNPLKEAVTKDRLGVNQWGMKLLWQVWTLYKMKCREMGYLTCLYLSYINVFSVISPSSIQLFSGKEIMMEGRTILVSAIQRMKEGGLGNMHVLVDDSLAMKSRNTR